MISFPKVLVPLFVGKHCAKASDFINWLICDLWGIGRGHTVEDT